MLDRTNGILQQWENGELSEEQVMRLLCKPRGKVRQMRAAAIQAGAITEAGSVTGAANVTDLPRGNYGQTT